MVARDAVGDAGDGKGWQDRIFEALGTGVDVTQIIEALKRTPTERLEYMRQAAKSLEDSRRGTRRIT